MTAERVQAQPANPPVSEALNDDCLVCVRYREALEGVCVAIRAHLAAEYESYPEDVLEDWKPESPPYKLAQALVRGDSAL